MLPGNIPEVFIDTDVAFDIVSAREPHFHTSVKLLELAADNKITLLISGSCIATLCYLSLDIYKIKDAQSKLIDLVQACGVASASKAIALSALQSNFKDKEDALQYFTAIHAEADYFITRNTKDYKSAKPALPVMSVQDFLNDYVTH